MNIRKKDKRDTIVATIISGVFALVIGLSTILAILNVDKSTTASGGGGVTLNQPSIMSTGNDRMSVLIEGGIYSWGYNNFGGVGDGTTTSRKSYVQTGNSLNWVSVSVGSGHSLALNDKGELWAWGLNNQGQLGIGNTTNQSKPVRVGTQSNWVFGVAGGAANSSDYYGHSFAINDKGELWAWGYNGHGQLGIGNTTNQNTPVRVGNKSDWSTIATGMVHALAINSKGELWAWGHNSDGRVGDGTKTNRTSPVRLGAATNWASIHAGRHHSIGMNVLGELWVWGSNDYGQLGDGTTTMRLSPMKLSNATNWRTISAGYRNSFAINSNGELWAWGQNDYGQLGDGTKTNRTSPVKIGVQANWVDVDSGSHQTLATNSKGELFTWGYNGYGELGLGDTTNRSAPQLVSGLTLGSSVAVPKSVVGVYNVSAPSKTRVFPGDSYTFTVTRTHGTGDIGLELNTGDNFYKNGKLELTAVNGNVLTYTVSNVLFSITADDFSVTTYSVESPTEKVGFTVSALSSTSVLVDGSYSFVITLDVGYALPRVVLNTSNGKVNYSGVDQNGEMRVTISNVVGNIAGDNFTVTVAKI